MATTETLHNLKIHKLSNEEYNNRVNAGTIDDTALYLTPDSGYVTAGQKEDEYIGERATAEGYNTIAEGKYSHAGGLSTVAKYACQTAFGRYNNYDSAQAENILFMVGNGDSDNNRSNAFAVLDDGRAQVYHKPATDNDVVRKIDLDGACKSIDLLQKGFSTVTLVNTSTSQLSGDEGAAAFYTPCAVTMGSGIKSTLVDDNSVYAFLAKIHDSYYSLGTMYIANTAACTIGPSCRFPREAGDAGMALWIEISNNSIYIVSSHVNDGTCVYAVDNDLAVKSTSEITLYIKQLS